jgi:hypothetical protein
MINKPPPIPNTPTPGIKNNSTSTLATPATNKSTSSQPAVPCRKLLQKYSTKQTAETNPGSPMPGCEISIINMNQAINNRKPAKRGEASCSMNR